MIHKLSLLGGQVEEIDFGLVITCEDERPSRPVPPTLRQYRKIKEQFPDSILLFRLGDFYEAFSDDAAIVARVCSAHLHTRDHVRMAGVPYYAIDQYIAQLISAGHKVAKADPKMTHMVDTIREAAKLECMANEGCKSDI